MDTYDPAALESIASLLSPDEGPDPRAIAAYLRGRENLGELGMAGGPALAPQASATLSGARGRLNDLSQRQGMVLKRALWAQGKVPEEMPDEATLAQAESLGFDRNEAARYPKRQLLGLMGSETQRRMADAARERRMSSPEALADKQARDEAMRLDAEAKRATIAEKRTTAASRPAEGEADLRKEWIGQVPYKNAQLSLEMFRKMETASDSAAGDISRIYAYMKMLDPGSMVKESEYATAQNSGGVPERIRNAYNKAVDGERLTPEQRAGFTSEARKILDSTLEAYNANAETYRRIAKSRGFRVENVVPEMKALGGGKAPAVKRRRVFNPATGMIEEVP